jgi:NMD protein affecting ribosome stability and mRNA decay
MRNVSLSRIECGPTTLRVCLSCQKETPHQIRAGAGATVKICVRCLERALLYEETRD